MKPSSRLLPSDPSSHSLSFLPPTGCNFTKEAKTLADRLGLTGWIKNSKAGTVTGRIQGVKSNVDQMVKWLSEEGSEGCKIERCQLTNQKAIVRPDYPKFTLKF
ncbi:acylphosphatase-2-like [Penaeus japonicus]|uniref:acylphosphatase-2-like n=1 Tax=Penaeus japonicus TaxID=27405 RepID=UPI001C70EE2A|nr:acylphosphatase-2-like [Penaeus japonicus]